MRDSKIIQSAFGCNILDTARDGLDGRDSGFWKGFLEHLIESFAVLVDEDGLAGKMQRGLETFP